jgi:hypothetical protein
LPHHAALSRDSAPALPLVLCPASFSKLGRSAVDLGPQSILVHLGLGDLFPPRLQLAPRPTLSIEEVLSLMGSLRL